MKMHPIVQMIVGGCAAAIATAIPLVDDGLLASETLSIILSGMVGTGLTAVMPTRKS